MVRIACTSPNFTGSVRVDESSFPRSGAGVNVGATVTEDVCGSVPVVGFEPSASCFEAGTADVGSLDRRSLNAWSRESRLGSGICGTMTHHEGNDGFEWNQDLCFQDSRFQDLRF